MKQELKYYLESGGIFACWKPYQVATVLGSGVAVCLCDPIAQVGGMNHFIHPKKTGAGNIAKFGNYSLPHLLKMMLELGARKENIHAHVVGGSCSPVHGNAGIGKKNVDAAKKYLKKNRIRIVNDDTGGFFGRKVLFNTSNGEIVVYKANNIREQDWNDD